LSDCQVLNPGVRHAISSTVSRGISSAKHAGSVKVASNFFAADPSAMHHGQSASSISSSH